MNAPQPSHIHQEAFTQSSLHRQCLWRVAMTVKMSHKSTRLFLTSLAVCGIISMIFHDTVVKLPSIGRTSTSSSREEYSSKEEQDGRLDRFPSVQDRIKIYMGGWYTPPCEGNDAAKIPYKFVNATPDGQRLLLVRELPRGDDKPQRTFVLSKSIQFDRTFYLDRQTMLGCTEQHDHYCSDTVQYMLPALDRLALDTETPMEKDIPTILQFGDDGNTIGYISTELDKIAYSLHFPIIKKFRTAYSGMPAISKMTQETCRRGRRPIPNNAGGPTLSTDDIIWRLESKRHFGPLPEIPPVDIPWAQKKNLD
jgi:hypothetical protein